MLMTIFHKEVSNEFGPSNVKMKVILALKKRFATTCTKS